MSGRINYPFGVRGYQVAAVQKLCEGVDAVYGSAVQGDIIEFGTGWGTTAGVLAQAMAACERSWPADWAQRHGVKDGRELYLLDSFEGLPTAAHEADTNMPHVQSGYWNKGSGKALDPHQLMGQCAQHLPAERVRILKGWFSETLPMLPAKAEFALVHIDSDFYLSAVEILDYLFDNDCFADGCHLFFDDWNCNHASNELGERRAWKECVERYNPSFSDCGDYGPFGHKFIIHKR